VLVEETSLAKTIERYCVADLPVDAQQRFAELFRKRSHWKGPDILPFVKYEQAADAPFAFHSDCFSLNV
jgi:hypothetical protein